MTEPDPLAAIKGRMAERVLHPGERADVDWLVGEVERLRGLLARLEWLPQWNSDGSQDEAMCPVCGECRQDGHAPGCEWVAALHPERETTRSTPYSGIERVAGPSHEPA
jgi:hypothetical protein